MSAVHQQSDEPQLLSDLEIDAVSGALSIADIPKAVKAVSDAIAAGLHYLFGRRYDPNFPCC